MRQNLAKWTELRKMGDSDRPWYLLLRDQFLGLFNLALSQDVEKEAALVALSDDLY